METHPPAPHPILRTLESLCAVDSTSGREGELLPALLPLLERSGARVLVREAAPGRSNVLALWGTPKVLFSTHLDGVSPFHPPRIAGETLQGRGACDAKGQIVAQILAIESLLASGRRDLAWLGVVGEETDSLGAREAFAWKEHFASARVLVNGEPTRLLLAQGQRGVDHLRLSCRGVPAHSGTPERGHSAIRDLLDWLEALRGAPLASHPDLGPEVWNLGLLRGGEAANAVPAHAEADLLVRTVPGSRFREAVLAAMPPTGTLEELLSEPPDRYPAVPGFPSAPMTFGSDAPLLRGLVPSGTVVLAGPGDIHLAHTDHESITLAELAAGIELNRRLALHFLEEQS